MPDRISGLKIYAVVATVVMVLLSAGLLSSILNENQPYKATSKESSPYTIASFPVTIFNNQSVPSPRVYDQLVVVNSSAFSAYEASNLQNVVWETRNNSVIPSWIQSGDTSNSINTAYWLRIPSELKSGGSMLIYLKFANKTTNLFSAGGNEGVYPTATGIYGQYDNGKVVFPAYWDFNGTNTPAGLTSIAFGPASVSYDNGALIYAPTGYYHSGFVTSASYPSDYIWMVNVSSYLILSGGPGVFPISISDTDHFSAQDNLEGFAGGFPFSVFTRTTHTGYYLSGLNHGTVKDWNTSMSNTSTYGLSWHANTVIKYNTSMGIEGSMNFSNVSETYSVFFSSYIETGGLGAAQIKENWVAGMYPLPNGVMPAYSVSYA